MKLVQECAANADFIFIDVIGSDGETVYTVVVPPWDLTEAVCPCPSFAHRGYCRHLDQALEMVCCWREDEALVEQSPEQKLTGICPVCGGMTRVVGVD